MDLVRTKWAALTEGEKEVRKAIELCIFAAAEETGLVVMAEEKGTVGIRFSLRSKKGLRVELWLAEMLGHLRAWLCLGLGGLETEASVLGPDVKELNSWDKEEELTTRLWSEFGLPVRRELSRLEEEVMDAEPYKKVLLLGDIRWRMAGFLGAKDWVNLESAGDKALREAIRSSHSLWKALLRREWGSEAGAEILANGQAAALSPRVAFQREKERRKEAAKVSSLLIAASAAAPPAQPIHQGFHPQPQPPFHQPQPFPDIFPNQPWQPQPDPDNPAGPLRPPFQPPAPFNPFPGGPFGPETFMPGRGQGGFPGPRFDPPFGGGGLGGGFI